MGPKLDAASILPKHLFMSRCLPILGWLLAAAAAAAQEPIERNDFAIDAVDGPVLGSSRIVGMGGAYTALAAGIDGAHWNPACYANRYPFEQDWWEWDLAFSIFGPGVFGQEDFFNNGHGVAADGFFFSDVGLRFQFGRFGFGLDFRSKLFDVNVAAEKVSIRLLEGHAGAGWAFLDGQLVVGLSARAADLAMVLPDSGNRELVHFAGVGPEAGVVIAPAGLPFRVGLAGRLPVDSTIDANAGVTEVDGVKYVRGFVLPERVTMPWEVQLGLAWQFGARPLNLRWEEPRDRERELEQLVERRRCARARAQYLRERGRRPTGGDSPGRAGSAQADIPGCDDLDEAITDRDWWRREEQIRAQEDEQLEKAVADEEERIYWARRRGYERLSRSHWLAQLEILIAGPIDAGVGMDAFLEQVRRPSGQDVSVSLRLGLECEPLAHWLRARAGFYLEPPRAAGASWRPHGTAGVEVRLFSWDLFGWLHPFTFKLGLTGDFAPGYVDLGLGVGFWH